MPTNILRKTSNKAAAVTKPVIGGPRLAVITAGKVAIRVELLGTPTADRLWAALPLYSTAETWGDSIHFETPIETGRERGARINGTPGDICFWIDDDRIIVPFGRTPISRPGEIRLPRPCNVWAKALDDVRALKAVRPGEKVEMRALVEKGGAATPGRRSR